MTDSPPQDLRDALQCKAWNCLPSQLQEQEYGKMERISYALNVYEVFRARKNVKDWTKWQKDNPEAFDIFDKVSRMRDATD